MSSEIDSWTADIHHGDARELLAELPSSSVNCVVTSPPYYLQRNYHAPDQIGVEDTVEEYITTLVAIGDELQRVLRPDGNLWLNLDDTYATERHDAADTVTSPHVDRVDYQPKSQMLIPHRVAVAFLKAGWISRKDIVWEKPNAMPESVSDRMATRFEYVYHFVQHPQYWFDLDAVREPHAETALERDRRGRSAGNKWEGGVGGQSPHSLTEAADEQNALHPDGKNPGDVWEYPHKAYQGEHSATYSEEFCERPIKAGCPSTVCSECSAPVDSGCDCETTTTAPGIVLDPFSGTGTTCRVAKDLGRRFIGFEVNADYVATAQERVGISVDEPHRLQDTNTPLSSFDS